MTVRQEVLEHIIDVIRAADAQGVDGTDAAREAFPGTPEVVLAAAWWENEERKTESWWKQVERTIDGEVIKAALLKGTAP